MSNNSNSVLPSYEELFSRNIGIVSTNEQLVLSNSKVGIAGVGGVGGAHAITLARMGVGEFYLADPDIFEPANMNRQAGATISTLGRQKGVVIKEMILSINPKAKVTVFEKGLTNENLSDFLNGVDIILDGLDAFAIPIRRKLYEACSKKEKFVIASGPLGLTGTLHVFGPGSMSFEKYFDFKSCRNFEECFVAFIVGTCPSFLQLGQIDSQSVNIEKQQGPSLAPSINLCAALTGAEALQILIHKKSNLLAPRFLQFDLQKKRMVRKYLYFGNRNPIQKLKRKIVLFILKRKK
jgi:molybdopterin/thiamine biosynthesis adenylyltransferase